MESLIALTGREIRCEIDEKRWRPAASSEVRGSHEKLTADTGWQPQIGFEELLGSILDEWRVQVST
jgi:GDP-4-dehydro-6-deoxy-D-mannose reductase